MSLVVTAATTERDWTTTGALKNQLVTSSTGDDARLSQLIRQASRWAESFIGYPIGVQVYEETLAGLGRRRMMLSRVPLRAVIAVFDATDTGQANDVTTELRVEDEEAGFITRDTRFSWDASVMNVQFQSAFPLTLTPEPGEEVRPWLVRYAAGWTRDGLSTSSPCWTTGTVILGSTSTAATLPDDVEMGVILRARDWWQDKEDLAEEKLGDLLVRYHPPDPARLSPAEAALAPYRMFARRP